MKKLCSTDREKRVRTDVIDFGIRRRLSCLVSAILSLSFAGSSRSRLLQQQQPLPLPDLSFSLLSLTDCLCVRRVEPEFKMSFLQPKQINLTSSLLDSCPISSLALPLTNTH